jgi:sugar lactone lactonase YvrE
MVKRICAAAAVFAAAALLPAAASAAGNPQVVRVDPTTGVVKALAGGAPFTRLGGLAVGPTGTLYVANQGPVGPSPRGAGLYSLAAPAYAISPVAGGTDPAAVVASGSTLYLLDGDRVVAIDAATGAQRVVTSGGLYDQLGVQPAFGAVSGRTLYTTAASSCASAEGGGAYVIAVDTVTGAQSLVKSFGCRALGGVATTPGGPLVVAVGSTLVQLDPAGGAVATMASGGVLKSPQGLALDASGDVIVADAKAGVVAVAARGGDQSPYTAPGAVVGARGVAVGADGGIYVTEAGPAPSLKATAARRQRFRRSGIAVTLRPSRMATVGYTAAISIAGRTGFAKSAAFGRVQGRRSVRIGLPGQVDARIASALRAGRRVTAKLTLRPQDPRSGSLGIATVLRVRLVA